MSKCTKCGRDFNGKFCPFCGTKAEEILSAAESAADFSKQPPISSSPVQQAQPISQIPAGTVPDRPASPSFSQQAAKTEIPSPDAAVRVKQPKGLLILITVLLILNLAATSVFGIMSVLNQNMSFEKQAEQSKAYREYLRENGKSITVTDDEYISSEYGSGNVQGTLKNDASYTMENVTVCVDFYIGDDYVDSAKDYIDKIPAGAEVQFDVYCPESEFDSYAVVYIEAEK